MIQSCHFHLIVNFLVGILVRCSDRLVVSLQRCLISAFSGAPPPPPPPPPSDAHKLSFCYQQYTSSYHRHLSQIKLDNNLCNCYITRRLPPFIWEVFYGNNPIHLETNWTKEFTAVLSAVSNIIVHRKRDSGACVSLMNHPFASVKERMQNTLLTL